MKNPEENPNLHNFNIILCPHDAFVGTYDMNKQWNIKCIMNAIKNEEKRVNFNFYFVYIQHLFYIIYTQE